MVGSDVELCDIESMTRTRSFTNVTFLIVIISCAAAGCNAALSDKQLCYDPNCSEPVSLAKTILAYNANDREVLSFSKYAEVKVFSKGAGKRTDLWGVEINGRRGFAPQAFLNEYKVLRRDLSYEVPVYKYNGDISKTQTKGTGSQDDEAAPAKVSRDESTPGALQESEAISADRVSPSYEVIDGTTVYLDDKPSVQPSPVSGAVHVTASSDQQAAGVDPETDPGGSSASGNSTSVNSGKSSVDDHQSSDVKYSPTDTQSEEISTGVSLESSEAMIDTVSDVASAEDTAALESGESKDVPSKSSPDDLEDEEEEDEEEEESVDSNAGMSIEDRIQEVKQELVSEGIFASLTKTFSILSGSIETATRESAQSNDAVQSSDDMPATSVPAAAAVVAAAAAAAANDTQSPERLASENVETKDNAGEKDELPVTPELGPSVDSSPASVVELVARQGDTHEDVKVSDEGTRVEREVSSTPLGNATSSSDVPSSNDFVHENTDEPAKELPAKVSLVSLNADVASTPAPETSSAGSVSTESATAAPATKTRTSSDSRDSAQSSDDTERKSGSAEVLENKSEAVNREGTISRVDEAAAVAEKILETGSIKAVEERTTGITTESRHDDHAVGENTVVVDETLDRSAAGIRFADRSFVHSNNVNKNNLINDATSSASVSIESDGLSTGVKSDIFGAKQSSMMSSSQNVISERMTLNEILQNQDLPNTASLQHRHAENQVKDHGQVENQMVDPVKHEETSLGYDGNANGGDEVLYNSEDMKGDNNVAPESNEMKDETCSVDHECTTESILTNTFEEGQTKESEYEEDSAKLDLSYWKTLMYVCVTAFTTLAFTLGYYYIENIRRDGQLIARINKLEKELLVSTKECEMLSENLRIIKEKLHCIEDESFGSNEMVASLKADLRALQDAKAELEDQVAMLDKELENATEAGLELERMLREVLSSNNEVNPLAQSVEDLQARLDAQHTANESLTNGLNLKAQEIETLSTDLVSATKRCAELEAKLSHTQDELATQRNLKNSVEQTLTDKAHGLEEQLNEMFTEKSALYKELKGKEIEMKELDDVINQIKSNNLDLDKLYDVFHVKSEMVQLREERDELKTRLSDVEGAHQLLEEHMKLVKEEIASLSDQCKLAEREKKDAETRLEVLSTFFKEKEAERQKEEAMWLQKQGEVVSTVERIHTMQNEIQNYKQQVEILKREIVDQEREYKSQISSLETKAHEQWVVARQSERRLEESKAEAGQLRNLLTLVEKNLNDSDSEAKLHRSGLEANGETTTSPPPPLPPLFIGMKSSNSPIMFSGSSGVPPPPSSYLRCFPPPYLPPLPTASGLPPYDIGQRPPPLGGRLSSPPPMPPPPHLHPASVASAGSGRYENAGSPPPLLLSPYDRHRSPPPPPYSNDHVPHPPLPGTILHPPLGTARPGWGEEPLPPPRNAGFHPHQREQPHPQRMRNHKGSLHSSGESLDTAHHGKV